MRISDWSSDVCSSDLTIGSRANERTPAVLAGRTGWGGVSSRSARTVGTPSQPSPAVAGGGAGPCLTRPDLPQRFAFPPPARCNARMPIHRLAVLALLAFALAACTHAPPRNPMAQWVPSPNFGPRQPILIVIHATEQESVQESLDTLRTENSGGPVSSHHQIGRAASRERGGRYGQSLGGEES